MSEPETAIEPPSLHEVALHHQQQPQNLSPGEPPELKFQIAGAARQYSVWPKRKIKRSWMEEVKKLRTKRIRIIKSVLIDGRPAAKGSIRDLAPIIADDLIAAGCAVQVNVFSRLFARIWFAVAKKKDRDVPEKEMEEGVMDERLMGRTEKAVELLERAEGLGLRLQFRDDAQIIVEQIAHVDEDILVRLMEYLPEVRAILKRRAVVALARKHIGARIFCEYGEGRLVSVSENNGLLTVSVNQGIGSLSKISMTMNPETLFMILTEAEAEGTSPAAANQKPEPELPRKRKFGVI